MTSRFTGVSLLATTALTLSFGAAYADDNNALVQQFGSNLDSNVNESGGSGNATSVYQEGTNNTVAVDIQGTGSIDPSDETTSADGNIINIEQRVGTFANPVLRALEIGADGGGNPTDQDDLGDVRTDGGGDQSSILLTLPTNQSADDNQIYVVIEGNSDDNEIDLKQYGDDNVAMLVLKRAGSTTGNTDDGNVFQVLQVDPGLSVLSLLSNGQTPRFPDRFDGPEGTGIGDGANYVEINFGNDGVISSFNIVRVVQEGDNTAIVHDGSYGSGNVIDVRQSGLGDSGIALDGGGDSSDGPDGTEAGDLIPYGENNADITLMGDSNSIVMDQFGVEQKSYANVMGNGNNVGTLQDGNRQESYVWIQGGDNNTIDVFQDGVRNNSDVEIGTGSGNTVAIVQDGISENFGGKDLVSEVSIGDGSDSNTVNVDQLRLSHNSFVDIGNNASSNTVDIDQVGSLQDSDVFISDDSGSNDITVFQNDDSTANTSNVLIGYDSLGEDNIPSGDGDSDGNSVTIIQADETELTPAGIDDDALGAEGNDSWVAIDGGDDNTIAVTQVDTNGDSDIDIDRGDDNKVTVYQNGTMQTSDVDIDDGDNNTIVVDQGRWDLDDLGPNTAYITGIPNANTNNISVINLDDEGSNESDGNTIAVSQLDFDNVSNIFLGGADTNTIIVKQLDGDNTSDIDIVGEGSSNTINVDQWSLSSPSNFNESIIALDGADNDTIDINQLGNSSFSEVMIEGYNGNGFFSFNSEVNAVTVTQSGSDHSSIVEITNGSGFFAESDGNTVTVSQDYSDNESEVYIANGDDNAITVTQGASGGGNFDNENDSFVTIENGDDNTVQITQADDTGESQVFISGGDDNNVVVSQSNDDAYSEVNIYGDDNGNDALGSVDGPISVTQSGNRVESYITIEDGADRNQVTIEQVDDDNVSTVDIAIGDENVIEVYQEGDGDSSFVEIVGLTNLTDSDRNTVDINQTISDFGDADSTVYIKGDDNDLTVNQFGGFGSNSVVDVRIAVDDSDEGIPFTYGSGNTIVIDQDDGNTEVDLYIGNASGSFFSTAGADGNTINISQDDDNFPGSLTLATVDVFGDNNFLDITQDFNDGRFGFLGAYATNTATVTLDGESNDIDLLQLGYNNADISTGMMSSGNVLNVVQYHTPGGGFDLDDRNYVNAQMDGIGSNSTSSGINSNGAYNAAGTYRTAAAQVFDGSLGTSIQSDAGDYYIADDNVLGWGNDYDIQVGDTVQRGWGNEINLEVMTGAMDNLFTLYQSGSENQMFVEIGGMNNELAIGQLGQMNMAYAVQNTDSNSAGILQVGNSNTAVVSQGAAVNLVLPVMPTPPTPPTP